MNRVWARRAAALLFSLCGTSSAIGANAVWSHYPGFLLDRNTAIAIGDFDGDGAREAVVSAFSRGDFTSDYYPQLLAIIGADATGTLGIQQMMQTSMPVFGNFVVHRTPFGHDELLVAAQSIFDRGVYVLDGNPLSLRRTLASPYLNTIIAVADIEANGQLEIVAIDADLHPVVLSYENGDVLWTDADTVDDIAVEQLDGDAALELVLGGMPGRIIDGATHAVEWTYPGGFKGKLAAGGFGTDLSLHEFAVAQNGNVQIFSGAPYSPLGQFQADARGVFQTVRVTEAGPDELAVGKYDVGIYDPRTALRIIDVPALEYGVRGLAIGDIDGDGRREMVYGSGQESSGADFLGAVDMATGHYDYAKRDELGPYSTIAVGNLSGTSELQAVYLTTHSESGYRSPNLHVLDITTGAQLREKSDIFGGSGASFLVAVSQLDNDAQQEIVAVAGVQLSGAVIVFDGLTLSEQWRWSGADSGYPAGFEGGIMGLAMLDVNNDGTEDVVLLGATGRIDVMNGRNGHLLWESAAIDGDWPMNLAAFHDNAGAPRIVMTRGKSMYVFNPVSHVQTATKNMSESIMALTQWGDGTSCRLGALDRGNHVIVMSCENLGVLGQHVMPANTEFFRPLDAEGTHYVAAAGAQLFDVSASGAVSSLGSSFGNDLGAHNGGVLLGEASGSTFDLLTGSAHQVVRIHQGPDQLFANGFDSAQH